MKNKYVECPKCGCILIDDDVYDLSVQDEQIVLFTYGHCPKCYKSYEWEKVFTDYHYRNFMEA